MEKTMDILVYIMWFLVVYGGFAYAHHYITLIKQKKITVIQEPTIENIHRYRDATLLQYLTDELYMRKKYKIFLDKIKEEDRLSREALHNVEVPSWQKASTFAVIGVPLGLMLSIFYLYFGAYFTIFTVLTVLFFFFITKFLSDRKKKKEDRKRRIVMGIADIEDFKYFDDYLLYRKFLQNYKQETMRGIK